MFILTVHWDLRLEWAVLTVTAKFYVFCLLAAAAYTTFFLVQTVSRIRRLQKDVASIDATPVKCRLIEMTRGIENLRQFHILLFFLFGMFFANEMFALIRAIEYSSMSLSAARIDVFEPVAAFAFFVFVVLTLLHVFQWIVAARLQSFFAANFNHPYLQNDS
jgi:flagellar biosynthesis protein FlhB